jgi:hypothetical protein
MTRRGAIIAALLAGAGKPASPEVVSGRRSWLTVDIPELPNPAAAYRAVNCKNPAQTFCLESFSPEWPKHYRYALEIRYKDRLVLLTADQIMDALEEW